MSDEYSDPRPCAGRDVAICFIEGCFTKGCLLNNTREEYDRRKREWEESVDELIVTTVEPVFGKAFQVQGDYEPTRREKWFGKKRGHDK